MVEPEEKHQAMDTLEEDKVEEHKVHKQERVGTQLMQLLKEPRASSTTNAVDVIGKRLAKDYTNAVLRQVKDRPAWLTTHTTYIEQPTKSSERDF